MRFRVTINNVGIHQLLLFNTAAAAYVWHYERIDDPDDVEMIELRKGDYVDVEWLGCEIIVDKKEVVYVNLVNCAYARVSENESGHVMEHVWGWVTDSVLPMNDETNDSLTIRRLQKDEGLIVPHPFPE